MDCNYQTFFANFLSLELVISFLIVLKNLQPKDKVGYVFSNMPNNESVTSYIILNMNFKLATAKQ